MSRGRHAIFLAAALLALLPAAANAAWSATSATGPSRVTAARMVAPSTASAAVGFGCAAPTVTWESAAGAERYRVERTLDAGATWTELATSTGTSAVDRSELPGAFTATYRVSSRLAQGHWTSAPTAAPALVCANAHALGASAGYGEATLTWNAATAAASYELERSVDGGGFTTLAGGLTTRTFLDRTQTAGGSAVTYRVRAVSATGVRGSWSDIATITWQSPEQVSREVTLDLRSSYCARVTVTNAGGTRIDWNATISLEEHPWAGRVTTLVGASTVSSTDTELTVRGGLFNRTLAPGASTTFTYCAQRTSGAAPAAAPAVALAATRPALVPATEETTQAAAPVEPLVEALPPAAVPVAPGEPVEAPPVDAPAELPVGQP